MRSECPTATIPAIVFRPDAFKKRGPQGPRFRTLKVALEAAVLLRHHAEKHWNRKHRVEARGEAGSLGRSRLLLGADLHDTERLLLVGPDDEPYVEPHYRAEPHAQADCVVAVLQRQGLADVAHHRRNNYACDDGGHGRPAEPEKRGRRDDLADGRLLLIGNLRHRRRLDEIEVPEQPD